MTSNVSKLPHFARPVLADHIADQVTGADPWSDASNGLFLAAPRRTGKTRFLMEDLLPALEKRGLLVIYVDLWEDKKRAPTDLIAEKLALVHQSAQGWVAKVAHAMHLDSISLLGALKVDTSKIGKTDGLTLHRVLELIHQQTGKRIVLIVDEAQHALTSEDGDNCMSALKSARDQMRQDGKGNLMLVMSGSHRDKLMRLLNTVAAPFWGSRVQPLETLGAPFVEALMMQFQRDHPQYLGLNMPAMVRAFELAGQRPQIFMAYIAEAKAASSTPVEFVKAIEAASAQQSARDREAISQAYLALNQLERAVLTRMLDRTDAFRAFDAAALSFYEQQLGGPVSAGQVQTALKSLCENNPPIVWKSLRGDYSIYDQDLVDWHSYLVGQQAWPPKAGN